MPKLIVDSSIWVDFFNEKASLQIEHLRMLLFTYTVKSPIIILPVIMQEVLQGIENDRFYNSVKKNFLGLDYINYQPYDIAVNAAQLYRSLRRKGIIVRKPNDCLIAASCIEFDIPLFHNDKDFDNIAKHTSLKIYKYRNDKNKSKQSRSGN